MKNKINYLVFFMLLLFPVFVFAAGNVTVSTTSITMTKGETKTFNIVASNAAGKVTLLSSNSSVASVNKSSEWVENQTLSVVVTGHKAGTSTISVVVDAATFNEEKIKKTYKITVTVTPPKSTNTNLGGLSLSSGSLSPSFSINTTKYTATVNADNVIINAIKGDNGQTISGTGKKTLKYGKNTFNIVVKSEAGTSKTYTIVITRPDTRKNDNYLKSLSVDKGSISFKKETLNYSVKVAKDVSSIKVSASVNDSSAKFVNGYGPRTVNLKYGVNNILVKVQAENETIKTYTIKVTREDGRSSNNNLSAITLSSGKINFSKDITNYKISVPYNVTKINVEATVEDIKSKVNVLSPNLLVGDNTITITVTAENGQSKVYKISVKRLEEQVALSNNNNVLSIDIKGHGIEFNPDIKEYDVNIGDEYALVIDVLLEDPSAKYIIEGNEDLKDGSIIKITSTSESGEVREYMLNIKKELAISQKNNSSCLIYGLIGFALGLGTMFITITLINKMKSKKEVKSEVQTVVKTSVIESKPEVAPVAPVSTPAPAPASAPSPVVESSPVAKQLLQEANVSQPVSQTANVIPENKVDE